MGLSKFYFLSKIIIIFIFSFPVSAQIIFKELPDYQAKIDSSFFDVTKTRSIILLNGAWKVYPADNKEGKSTEVLVPSIFDGEGDLTFEKEFSITQKELTNDIMYIYFLGMSYSADISVNNIIIYRHTGGEFPFHFELPHDILRVDKKNVLTVKLSYKLDSENTIPVKQRFLFPQNFGGIFRDVYIHLIPNVSISDLNIISAYDSKSNKSTLNIKAEIVNRGFKKNPDTIEIHNNFNLKVNVFQPDGASAGIFENKFSLANNKSTFINGNIEIKNPSLWSPSNPGTYLISTELWRGDSLIDITKKEPAIYSLSSEKNSLLFNGNSFQLKGVTYIPSFEGYGSLAPYDKMEDDIKMIKELGFNSIRFAKSVPHPYYLKLCKKYGLLAFVELPINFIPASLSSDRDFIVRSQNYLTNFIKAYKVYPSVAAIGLCSSVLPNVEENISFVENLAILAKKNYQGLIYASFISTDQDKIHPIQNIDLYGIEILNSPLEDEFEKFDYLQRKLGKGKVFISGATYVVNQGKSDGYVNKYSYEAQAKYFDDLTDYADKDSTAAYFINSMFDFRGDYASLIAGYNKDNIYHLGIVGEDRNTDRIGYKVLYAKFHNTEKVTIPIGSRKDNAPMVFIIMGILLALIMGILVNSGRKFREDASRALVRPYNFYADVRDQRIISGFHSTLLAIVISAVLALVLGNLLYYFKMSVELEKILISFGSPRLIEIISYLSWHPFMSIVWLTLIFMVLLLVSTVIIKISSFCVRNKVYYSSIYFSTVWAFLPFVLLILVGIILYRLLLTDVANLYIYILLAIFCLWAFYRLMKGIYVIFDVNPSSVYFYSIILVTAFIGIIVVYYELRNSFIGYLLLTLKQY
jgi:beta-galactosidase